MIKIPRGDRGTVGLEGWAGVYGHYGGEGAGGRNVCGGAGLGWRQWVELEPIG